MGFVAIFLLLLLVIVVLYFKLYRLPILLRESNQLSKRLQNIPIPPPTHFSFLPVSLGISHLVDLMRNDANPWEVITGWTARYGNILRFSFLFNNFIIVSDVSLVRHILQERIENYKKDTEQSYAPFLCLLGTGLVTSEGHLWHQQRSLISPVFRNSILDETAFVAKLAVKRLIAKIDALLDEKASQTNNPNPVIEIEISEEFRHLTLQVIGSSVLGVTPEESDRVFPQLYLPIVSEANLRVWNPLRAYIPTKAYFDNLSAIRQLNDYLSNLITTRIQLHLSNKAPEKEDVLQKIINQVYKTSSPGSTNPTTLNVNQMRDEIKTFLFAGHETSSMMLTWAFYEAIKNKEVYSRLITESIGMWGTSFSYLTTPESIERNTPGHEINEIGRHLKDKSRIGLQYTENVLKEALRKYSIVPVVTRQVVEDEVVGEYFLPKGAKIVIPIKAMNERADLWGKDVKEFKPERFDEKMEGLEEYRWLGFIAGKRRCVGQQFALLETKIVLSLLMNRYEVELGEGFEEVAKHKFNIPIGPENGLNVKFRRRLF